MAWPHKFESFNRRVKKVYPKVVLLLHHLLDFSRITTEYDAYDDVSDVEEGEVLIEATPSVYMEIENTSKS